MSIALVLTLLLLLVDVWRFDPFDVEMPADKYLVDMPRASPCLLEERGAVQPCCRNR